MLVKNISEHRKKSMVSIFYVGNSCLYIVDIWPILARLLPNFSRVWLSTQSRAAREFLSRVCLSLKVGIIRSRTVETTVVTKLHSSGRLNFIKVSHSSLSQIPFEKRILRTERREKHKFTLKKKKVWKSSLIMFGKSSKRCVVFGGDSERIESKYS